MNLKQNFSLPLKDSFKHSVIDEQKCNFSFEYFEKKCQVFSTFLSVRQRSQKVIEVKRTVCCILNFADLS